MNLQRAIQLFNGQPNREAKDPLSHQDFTLYSETAT